MAPAPINSSSGSPPINPNQQMWGAGKMPPEKPLPADDPWCKNLKILFPNLPETQIQEYAGRFRDNMFNAFQNELKREAKKQKEAAEKLKRVAKGEE